MKDKATIGFVAGMAGGVFMNFLDFILASLRWANVRYIDYTAVFIFGNKPVFWFDSFFALLVHIIFTGILGIIFAYLLDLLSCHNHLLKGGIYGVAAWFSFYLIAFLHKIPLFIKISWQTAVCDIVTSTAYGLVLAGTLRRLTIKYMGNNEWKGSATMRDRFVSGLIAGVAGGTVQVIADFVLKMFHLGNVLYLDYAAIIIYGNRPSFWFDALFAQLVYLGFTGLTGIAFAYLTVLISTRNYLLKGWIFAIGVWFTIFAAGIMYKVPLLQKVPWQNAVSHFISASLHGLVLAGVLHRLTKKFLDSEA